MYECFLYLDFFVRKILIYVHTFGHELMYTYIHIYIVTYTQICLSMSVCLSNYENDDNDIIIIIIFHIVMMVIV